MKNSIKNIASAALAVALMAPLGLLAQEGKEKEKDKEVKEKKDVETIIITRKNADNDKVVVELNGDKVIVNGKEVKDGEGGDVSVHRSKIKDVWAYSNGAGQSFNWNGNGNLFSMDENRAMLGVTTDKTEGGAIVEEVTKESAAEKAGLKKGDVITRIDDMKITSPDDLSAAVKKHKPGDKVTVTYLRDKKEQKLTTELTKWKGTNIYTTNGFNMNMDRMEFPRISVTPEVRAYGYRTGTPKLGVSVQDAEDGKGVKVLDVDEDGNAAKAGLKEDDVITDIDGQAVNSADEVAKIIREAKDKISVKMKVQRKGKTETIDVKIPRKLKTANL